MTDQELKKLHRSDLLELLIAQEKENEQLRGQVKRLEAQLADRKLDLEKAGSIAEASLQLNGVFQAAQDAATLVACLFSCGDKALFNPKGVATVLASLCGFLNVLAKNLPAVSAEAYGAYFYFVSQVVSAVHLR